MPEPNKVVLVSLHCLCRSGPSLESHICCFRNPVCLHTTTSCLIAALHSALLHSQRVMKLSLNSFIYYFSALPVADEPKQTVSRCALAATPTWETRSSQRWMDGLLPAYLSLWLPFFFSFVASVKCMSSHLTPPQTVSHSLPSHLINHAIELNATQQKKKKKGQLAEGVTWFAFPFFFFFVFLFFIPLQARLQLPGRFVCHGPCISPRPLF